MTKALEGIRILDLTSGPAGGITSMILADFGAEVVVVERKQTDLLAELPATPMWQRGKDLIQLDLDTEHDLKQLDQLCAAADVFLCNWRTTALQRKGLDYDTVHLKHPHLIYCHISGFGSHGPRADYPGYEHLIAACIGRMQVFRGLVDREGPVFSALQVGVHACAQTATSGILAALLDRGKEGEGRLVETSILQAMLAYEQGAMLAVQFRDQFTNLLPVMQSTSDIPPMPSLYYHPAQASDGRWMQFGNLLPHLFDNFLIVTGLIDVIADPDFNPKQMTLAGAKHEAFRERMLTRIQERTADEWMADFVSDGGVVATAYQTTRQALSDPDIVANGHVIQRDGGGVQLGPLAKLTQTPAEPGPPARSGDTLAQAWKHSPRPAPITAASTTLPLAGIRVIEIATIIAAPLAASFLADMGADVIKVEQVGGDPFRSLAAGIGSARVNGGKRSISLNLKSAAGKAAVLELTRNADVLIHNYRPGVPERLGIGYEELKTINPGLIYLQSNGYGPDGPGALRPSTHPIPGAAMGGVMYQMGERVPTDTQNIEGLRLWTRRLMRANEVNPDPNTALVVTSSVMLGLVAREQTGQGQQVLVDMFGANAYANSDDFLSYPGKPGRAMPDVGLHGLSPLYRLYRCADNQWVFLAIPATREQVSFIDCLLDQGIDAPELSVLAAADKNTSRALEEFFSNRNGDDWEQLLATRGVGCVRADARVPSEFWLEDPQAQALELTCQATHPAWGDYQRHGSLVRFDREVPSLNEPPLAGQHNHEILTEQGYDRDTIDQMLADGVLWQQ